MPRPHTEFLKTDSMPWGSAPAEWGRPAGSDVKVLSRDARTGACSALVRYPPCASSIWTPDRDEEFFVLDGAFVVDDTGYRARDYAYLPATHAQRAILSESGAVVLSFFEAEGGGTTAGRIRKLETARMPWSAPSDATLTGGRVRRKLLKPEDSDGERTWLLKWRGNEVGEWFEVKDMAY